MATPPEYRFTKNPDGTWAFFSLRGNPYVAFKNEAGFRGRQWELRTTRDDGTTRMVDLDFATRAACMVAANRIERYW